MQDIVLCSDEGLAVRIGGGPVMSLPWTDVRNIHAYRVDAVHSQPLIVGVEDETGHAVEIGPAMEGWPDFLARVANLAELTAAELNQRLERLTITDEPATLFQRDAPQP